MSIHPTSIHKTGQLSHDVEPNNDEIKQLFDACLLSGSVPVIILLLAHQQESCLCNGLSVIPFSAGKTSNSEKVFWLAIIPELLGRCSAGKE